MNQLDMNKYQAAAAALSLLGLKHTSDKVATSQNSGLSNDLRLAEEQKKAKAHEALADLNTKIHEELVAAQNVVEAEVIDDDEIEIRVGNRIVRVTVE